MTDFIAPPELQNQDAQTIFNRMKTFVPDNIDTSEGSFFYDATFPLAIEKASMIEEQLFESIKLIFPQWSYEGYLDMHAELAQTQRKPATPSTTVLTITGANTTVIPKGFVFATPAALNLPSILFETTESATIASGTASISAACQTSGKIGNVAAGTVVLMYGSPIPGVTSVTNASAATGGTDAESDEELIARITEIRRNPGGAGSKSDYKIWAKEVAGIGDATVIPEWQGVGSGTVKVIVIDSNGDPASPALVQSVQDYITPADGSGKAPIGAIVTVVAPTAKTINYALTLTPNTAENVAAIKTALAAYYKTVGAGGTVKYSAVFAAIAQIPTISDISGLTINAGTANIVLQADEYPVTGTVNGV